MEALNSQCQVERRGLAGGDHGPLTFAPEHVASSPTWSFLLCPVHLLLQQLPIAEGRTVPHALRLGPWLKGKQMPQSRMDYFASAYEGYSTS